MKQPASWRTTAKQLSRRKGASGLTRSSAVQVRSCHVVANVVDLLSLQLPGSQLGCARRTEEIVGVVFGTFGVSAVVID